ncbi:hypothetical protein Tco_0798754 [Tanacetum coccineum]
MASQDARLSKFEADFKQQQSEMTNKIDTVLKAITDRIAGTLPSDTVKNPKLGTHPVSSARSYPIMDPQCSTQIHSSINTITIHPKQPKKSQVNEPDVEQEEGNLRNTDSNPQPRSNQFASIATEQDDGEVMFIEIIRDDEPQNKDPNEGEEEMTEEPVVEYFDTFPTRNELTYHSLSLDEEDKRKKSKEDVMSKILWNLQRMPKGLDSKNLTGGDDKGESHKDMLYLNEENLGKFLESFIGYSLNELI